MKFILIALFFQSFAFADFDQTHSRWSSILEKYLHQSQVSTLFDYQAMKKNITQLNKYLESLESVSSQDFTKFSNDQKLSYWINAYNAYTIKLVINHYPIKSIRKIKSEKPGSGLASFFKRLNPTASPWKIPFIKLHGKKLTLDNIEHDIIRKKFSEPRVHFALNCASMGCPSLTKKAFNQSNLEYLLTEASKNFVKNIHKNKIDHKNKTIKASKIFKWYGNDFKKKYGGFIEFIEKISGHSNLKSYKLSWQNYDWSLNAISH